MVILAIVIALASYAVAIAFGLWLVRRVQIAPPPGARGRVLFDWSFKVWTWSIRLFILLIVFLMVTWPIALLLRALL